MSTGHSLFNHSLNVINVTIVTSTIKLLRFPGKSATSNSPIGWGSFMIVGCCPCVYTAWSTPSTPGGTNTGTPAGANVPWWTVKARTVKVQM